MADIEKEVEALIYAGLGDGEQESETTSGPHPLEDSTPEPETEERKVIDVDLYRLPGGAMLLVPGQDPHPLDSNAVKSDAAPLDTPVSPQTDPLEEAAAPEQEEDEPATTTTPTAPLTPRRKRGISSSLLVPLILVLLLAGGAASYFFLLPLTATATVTITPDTKTLHAQTTLTITASPKGSQVQGRTLAPFSLTASKTVPATGHGHQDATSATGVVTFYNSDANPITIPADVAFTAQNGATVVTDNPVTVQLEQVATTLLAHTVSLEGYQQIGTVQVTITGSTYTKTAAQLRVSLTGVWVYHFSPGELTYLTGLIAGETQENAEQQLEKENGIRRVSLQISRLDFKDMLPTDPAHIHLMLFIVSMA
jgi:hypothetical protein